MFIIRFWEERPIDYVSFFLHSFCYSLFYGMVKFYASLSHQVFYDISNRGFAKY